MMNKLLSVALATAFTLPAMAQLKTIYIHANTVACTGVAPTQCMQYRYKPTGQWKRLYGNIQGFTHEPGYFYTLQIQEKKIARPPADGSNIVRTLVKVLTKKPATPNVTHMKGEWTIASVLVKNELVSVQEKNFTVKLGDSTLQAKICNTIRGKIHIAKDGTVKTGPLMSTKMACADVEQEFAFTQALAKATQWEVSNEQLRMMDKTGKVYAVLVQLPMEAIPIEPANINYEAMLNDSRFTVKEIQDAKGITTILGSGAFIKIDKTGGRISGNGGCNNFFGNASVQFTGSNTGTVRFSKLGSTMMACPNKLQEEQRLFKLLEQADAFIIQGGELHIKRGTEILIKLSAE